MRPAPLTDSLPDASIDAPPPRATWRFLLAHPAHAIALGLGSGLAPKAPGTAGTLLAWLLHALLLRHLPPPYMALVLIAGGLAGWWACTLTAQHLRVPDPGCIVWDEIIAFWLVLALLPWANFWQQLAAFIFFRLFDTTKPPPVRWAERHFKGLGWRGGWGIVFDDLVAALCTLALLAFWPYFLGI